MAKQTISIGKASEVIGWFGVVLIILAYALLSFHIISSISASYQMLNLVGAICVIYISWLRRASQPFVLNIFWASIALVALLGILFNYGN